VDEKGLVVTNIIRYF